MFRAAHAHPHRPSEPIDHHDLVLQPRDVTFDWGTTPLHWLPGEPFATHTFDVLHLMLPELERWFVRTFEQALPLITDDRLREDVRGFIGQEAMHAEAHQEVLEHLLAKGLDPSPYTRQSEWIFRRVLGDRPELTPAATHAHLLQRLALIAAFEHFTAYMGHWILSNGHLDQAGADPAMLDLFRWHGAEEVEHRSVAFDLLVHLDPRYRRRVVGMLVTAPVLIRLWIRGVRFLMSADPELDDQIKVRFRDYLTAARKDLLPPPGAFARSVLRYFRPGYHPTQEGSTQQAVAYLAASPAARAAAQ
ncbi:UNVERIFIED_CONTAM: putative metal-dependent hydrolase [Streptomyces canus]